ncbi:hypothetical protein K438DRAFT_1795739 [Mycena galopus ATCC 62051]|nr:hypothetical protein K438DRAFT_1795739 [Mycena galopus ATCC 62051]
MATLLSTRAVLLEQTERTRQSSKSDIARFIEQSELKITSLESQINPLVELRDRERTRVAVLKSIISPFRTLPIELVAEIFKLTIRDHTHMKDAFRIAQICSDWRQVAHSTPRLWTKNLRVNLSNDSDVYADGLKQWLARSAPLPIHISLPCSTNIAPRILEDVLSIAPRCGSLQLEGRPESACQLVSQLAPSKLDILEKLDLGKIDTIDDIDGGVDFITVPRLRLRNLSICVESNLSQILMPWAQLTDLTLKAYVSDIALDILAQCPNLVTASVTTPGWYTLPQGRNIVTLTHLHTLSLPFFGSAEYLTPFLDCISAPTLDELCLDFGKMIHGVERWTEAHFTAFQLRAPNITQLELNYSDLTSDDLMAVIRHAPFITHLKLRLCNYCLDDALVATLYYENGVTPMLPRLHNLVLEIREVEEERYAFAEANLAGMIASRWWTDAEMGAHSTPPAVARWTYVRVLGPDLADMLEDMPDDVLILDDDDDML